MQKRNILGQNNVEIHKHTRYWLGPYTAANARRPQFPEFIFLA